MCKKSTIVFVVLGVLFTLSLGQASRAIAATEEAELSSPIVLLDQSNESPETGQVRTSDIEELTSAEPSTLVFAHDGIQIYRVRVDHGANTGLIDTAITQSGAQLLSRDQSYLFIAATSRQVDTIVTITNVDIVLVINESP